MKIRIKQSYNTITLETDTVEEAVSLAEDLLPYCTEKTEISFTINDEEEEE